MNVFMKTLRLAAWCLPMLLWGGVYAQGNLQFNQVRKITWTQTTPVGGVNNNRYHLMGPFVVTVPAGKVLKIESMNVSKQRITPMGSYQEALGASSFTDPPSLFLEETMVFSSPSASGTSAQNNLNAAITWLPAGDHNFYIAGFVNSIANTYAALLTSIEFNIVP
jgi:hypothetical protein